MRAISARHVHVVEELVRRHQASVRGFLVFLGCPPGLVDDLAQDVFLSMLSSSFEDRGPAATAGYLRKVARNLLLKALQRERRLPLVDDLDVAEQVWVELRGDDEGASYLDALRDCVTTLGPRASEVLRLRYATTLSREAIADGLGLTESGVKSILVRTRKALRECVERRVRR